MNAVSDEYMKEMLQKIRPYTLVILRAGPRRSAPGADRIIWEHGRRNFALREEGALAIVCPVGDEQVAGIAIFNRSREETEAVMREDPAIKEGVLVYSIHTCRSFPGDRLP